MRAWNVTLSMAICLAASVGWAEKVELRGTVVTWEGKVAAKAEVHLVRRTVEPWKSDLLASTTADEQGRFYLDGVELPGPEPRTFSVEVMSWTDGYSLGWCAPGAQHPANLKIELGKLGTFRGKVQDSAGKPVEGAIVGLGSLWRQLPGERFRSDYLLVPEDLGKRWAVQTDKDGGFRVPWAGENTRPSLFVAKDGYCRGNVNWKDSETEAGVVLYRSGAIRGQVRCAVANVSVAGYRVAYMAHQMLGQTSLIRSHGPAKNVTDAQGRFALEDVPPGQFRVYVAAEPTSEWQSGEGQDVELAEGQTKDNVTLELKRGAKVSGRVVDADTDAPIADVALYATGPV
ncbi:MAG: hypothetical protein FJ279_27080, partial [Planctomycetes bacterium]|nr:hypothetical protein [Planctomycetota bacterium]